MLFGLFVSILGAQIWGVVGILVVVVAGLLMVLPLKAPGPLQLRGGRRKKMNS